MIIWEDMCGWSWLEWDTEKFHCAQSCLGASASQSCSSIALGPGFNGPNLLACAQHKFPVPCSAMHRADGANAQELKALCPSKEQTQKDQAAKNKMGLWTPIIQNKMWLFKQVWNLFWAKRRGNYQAFYLSFKVVFYLELNNWLNKKCLINYV